MWTIKRCFVACDEDGEVYELLYSDSIGRTTSVGHIIHGRQTANMVANTLNKSMVKI